MRIRAALLLLLAACGPDGRDDGPGGGGGGGSGSGSGNGNGDGCSDAAKQVYVVDTSNKLSRFEPATRTFVDLGTLSCPAGFLSTPFSMGIDRNTVAWVLYSGGELFRVDTTTLQCTRTSWTMQSGLFLYGMGFSANTAGSTDDTLWIAGGSMPTTASSVTLATLDTTTFQATTVGTVQGSPELTGTGSAELWGWFPSPSQPRVQQINKANGQAGTTFNLSSLAGEPSAWAFAFWGGDFWIFLERDTETSTTVYQVDGTNGTIKSTTPTGNRQIVGAGVSTCAPTIIL